MFNQIHLSQIFTKLFNTCHVIFRNLSLVNQYSDYRSQHWVHLQQNNNWILLPCSMHKVNKLSP